MLLSHVKYLKFMGEMEFPSFPLPPHFPKKGKKKAFKGPEEKKGKVLTHFMCRRIGQNSYPFDLLI